MGVEDTATPSVSSRRAEFDKNGYLLIKGFATAEECAGMRKRMEELIDSWDPEKTMAPVFATDEVEQLKHQASSDYFLDSADRIHFFLEAGATEKDGKLKKDMKKHAALNKVGHGLHVVDDVFQEYSYSDKVTDLVADLGWKDAVLPQSMYIFKQPGIGGEVTAHQDSSFLHTTPRTTCMGLWLSLHHATLENGCLWARPGSHREPVRRLFVRNPDYFEKGDKTAPKMIFESCNVKTQADEWEGKMPTNWEPPESKGLYDRGFVPLICEPGDLVVIDGSIDHMSLPNTSEKQRETYQLHLIEGPSQGITWSPRNWLQYPAGKSFPSLAKGVANRKRKAEEAGL